MRKVRQILKQSLREGLEPELISRALALGITCGVFPIYGPFSLLVGWVAWKLRMNLAIVMAGYYAMTFIKPLLILPFLSLGETLVGAPPMSISLVELGEQFALAPWATLQEFAASFGHAIMGWAVAFPVIYTCSFIGCAVFLKRSVKVKQSWS